MAYTRSSFTWVKLEYNKFIGDYSPDHFEGDLNDVIKRLQQLQLDYAGVYHRINLSVNYDYESTSISVYGYSWETDEEYSKRLANQEEMIKDSKYKEKKRLEAKAAKEYETYLELKKKFEKD